MSVFTHVRFNSGSHLGQVLEERNPGLDPWDYARVLGSQFEWLQDVARKAGTDLRRFVFRDPDTFEELLPYIGISESEATRRREELTAQTKWHPVHEGVAAFERTFGVYRVAPRPVP